MKRVLFAFSSLFAASCGRPAEAPSSAPALAVSPVDWNPHRIALGSPSALVERGEEVVVFQPNAATVLESGSQVANDTSVPAWLAGSVIPAPYGNGTWVVGVAADGRVLRLRDESHFETVSDRFGLDGAKTIDVCSPGPKMAAFLLPNELAWADGAKVTRYPIAAKEMACGGGAVALLDDAGITVLRSSVAPLRFGLAASHVALAPTGRLLATSGETLYAESTPGHLGVVRTGSSPLRSLVATANGAWFLEGSELGLWTAQGAQLSRGMGVPESSRLVSSASGDVWVLGGGGLARYSVRKGATPADQWMATIDPIFERSCRTCHGPGGSSGVDLGSFSAWSGERANIVTRVITQKSMPPPGVPFSDSDREVVRRWAETPP